MKFKFLLKIILALSEKRFIHLNDKFFLRLKFRYKFNKKLNLSNPKTFNEKLQWIKIYDRKPIYNTMVDKYAVKGYVSDIIGEEFIIPTISVYDKFEQINFEQLPEKFVIKCTHDSGGLVICKNKEKLDIEKSKQKIEKSLKRNYFYYGREWPYKNVKPKILIEEYMEDKNQKSMIDYKFFCFNGKPKYILVCSERDIKLKETFFDLNWNLMPVKRPNKEQDTSIKKPENLELMINFAKKLSKEIPFLRVDFYEINKKLYFGELTFFPASGFAKFEPEEWDYKLGQLIQLDKVDKNEK